MLKITKKAVIGIILPLAILSTSVYGYEEVSGEITGCTDYFEIKIFGLRILRKYTNECHSNPDGQWDWFGLS
ncbi:hypothetical protein FYC62_13225 [Pedobacter aquae]|uniref:Uncharacterized protein n=1 Tax=Pedobacter aquae TaxID=2605747 RepID=A0A5C0VK74_9SPHI|nr:hypothetical protein [Pedobacter aquae]QEK52509.1 hypothetical protein FYC62_13225 [Pedobacter aquae]